MAVVSKVITPFFFSEKEPYMIVLFKKDSVNIFQAGACSSPHYIQIYDLRKIYLDITDVYEAQTRFKEEMKVGHHEAINLFEFTISDLTDGKYFAIRSTSVREIETQFRVGSYDVNKGRVVAKEILLFYINHRLFEYVDR